MYDLLPNCSGISPKMEVPPSVVWITPFPFVVYVRTHYPEMVLPS